MFSTQVFALSYNFKFKRLGPITFPRVNNFSTSKDFSLVKEFFDKPRVFCNQKSFPQGKCFPSSRECPTRKCFFSSKDFSLIKKVPHKQVFYMQTILKILGKNIYPLMPGDNKRSQTISFFTLWQNIPSVQVNLWVVKRLQT